MRKPGEVRTSKGHQSKTIPSWPVEQKEGKTEQEAKNARSLQEFLFPGIFSTQIKYKMIWREFEVNILMFRSSKRSFKMFNLQ